MTGIIKPRRTTRTEQLDEMREETRKRLVAQLGSQFKDWDPLIEMSLIAADKDTPRRERVAIMMEIVQYWYPKQKAIEVDVNMTGGATGVLMVPGSADGWEEAAAKHRETLADTDKLLNGASE